MASPARARLESLLAARRLDCTLTTAAARNIETASIGIDALDACLGGGFPRGQVSEIVGPAGSGRTSLLLQTLAAATRRGELVAVVDALDMFDVETAAAAGVVFDRVLWVRGSVASAVAGRETNQRALEQAVKALSLVLQAGNFGIVALDLVGAPGAIVRRLPFTTWLRLQRLIEGSITTCLVMAAEPIARSAAGVTLVLDGTARFGAQLFDGLDVSVRLVNCRIRTGNGRPVLDPREGCGPNAAASGGGAPRDLNNVCVSLSAVGD